MEQDPPYPGARAIPDLAARAANFTRSTPTECAASFWGQQLIRVEKFVREAREYQAQ